MVEVLRDVSQQDTTAGLRKFFQEENERAREHEMRLFQLFMSGTGSQAFTPYFTAQSQGLSTNNLPALNSPGPSHMYHQPTGSVMAGMVRKEFQTTVSMNQVKCINNPGAMRQIRTQLGQLTTAYEIISNKSICFSHFFLSFGL